jgi:hypothetical protein
MNANLIAAGVNLILFAVWMSLGWWIAAVVAVVCIAFSLTAAAVL